MTFYGVSLSNIIVWVLFGAIMAASVHLIDQRRVNGGFFPTIVLGMAGSLLGGLFAIIFFNQSVISLSVLGVAVAIAAGVIVAAVARLMLKERNHIKTMMME